MSVLLRGYLSGYFKFHKDKNPIQLVDEEDEDSRAAESTAVSYPHVIKAEIMPCDQFYEI